MKSEEEIRGRYLRHIRILEQEKLRFNLNKLSTWKSILRSASSIAEVKVKMKMLKWVLDY